MYALEEMHIHRTRALKTVVMVITLDYYLVMMAIILVGMGVPVHVKLRLVGHAREVHHIPLILVQRYVGMAEISANISAMMVT